MKNHQTKIIVIDDEPAIRQSLTDYLSDFDFQVTSAACAEEALNAIKESHFDIAIVDLRLPEMSGDVMILHAKKINSKTRFLIHTGSTNYRLSDELKNIGVEEEHILLKPQSDLNIFIKAINKLVDSD